mmetsp:Transcript_32203/g.90186  ORF Transcript_32203/g.90186 Transcript_32203/m.90186 type:complete len:325 (+) Transcript_32203:1225-2199(+)
MSIRHSQSSTSGSGPCCCAIRSANDSPPTRAAFHSKCPSPSVPFGSLELQCLRASPIFFRRGPSAKTGEARALARVAKNRQPRAARCPSFSAEILLSCSSAKRRSSAGKPDHGSRAHNCTGSGSRCTQSIDASMPRIAQRPTSAMWRFFSTHGKTSLRSTERGSLPSSPPLKPSDLGRTSSVTAESSAALSGASPPLAERLRQMSTTCRTAAGGRRARRAAPAPLRPTKPRRSSTTSSGCWRRKSPSLQPAARRAREASWASEVKRGRSLPGGECRRRTTPSAPSPSRHAPRSFCTWDRFPSPHTVTISTMSPHTASCAELVAP